MKMPRCNACGKIIKRFTGFALIYTLPETKDIHFCAECLVGEAMGLMRMIEHNTSRSRWKCLLLRLENRPRLKLYDNSEEEDHRMVMDMINEN